MPNLTKQILLKMTPELDQLINDAFSKYLKETGKYITRSDYIRCILKLQTQQQMKDSIFLRGNVYQVLKDNVYANTKDVRGSYDHKPEATVVNIPKGSVLVPLESDSGDLNRGFVPILCLLNNPSGFVMSKLFIHCANAQMGTCKEMYAI